MSIRTIAALLLFGSAALSIPAAQSADISTITVEMAAQTSATYPAAATPKNRGTKKNSFAKRHAENLKRIKQGPIDLLFMGDSITDRWSGVPDVWKAHFGKWNPANFGIGGDRTEGVLWRITNGEFDGISPKVMVLMIGTNNTHSDSAADIVTGIKRIIEITHQKLPKTKILLLAVFPREPKIIKGKPDMVPIEKIKVINKELPKLADKDYVHFMNIGDKFKVDGKVPKTIMPDGVHPTHQGYEIWANAIEPTLDKMMK